MGKNTKTKIRAKGLISIGTILVAAAILIALSFRFSKAIGESELNLSLNEAEGFNLYLEKEEYCFDDTIYLTIENSENGIVNIIIDCLNYTFSATHGTYLIEPSISDPNSEKIECKIIGRYKEDSIEKIFSIIRCENSSLKEFQDTETVDNFSANADNLLLDENNSTEDEISTISNPYNNEDNITEQTFNSSLQYIFTKNESIAQNESIECSETNLSEGEFKLLENETSEKRLIKTKRGDYEFLVLNGQIEVEHKEENMLEIEIFNFTSKEEVKIFIKLPFKIDESKHLYFWKEIEGRTEELKYEKTSNNIVSFYLKDLIEETEDVEEEIQKQDIINEENEKKNEKIRHKEKIKFKLLFPQNPSFSSVVESDNGRRARILIEEVGVKKEYYIESNKGRIDVKVVEPNNIEVVAKGIKDYTFSYKMAKLRITNISAGEEVELIFYYPFEIVENPKVIKFDSQTKRITEVPFEKIDDNKIKVRMIDGGEYDEDKEANGIILDDIGIQLNEIVDGVLNPDNIGYGVNVTIRAVIESIYPLENVSINITSPNNILTTAPMTFHSNGLSGWNYVRSILINNTAPRNLTNYQIMINLNTSGLISQGKMRTDCNDIRFADSDGVTLLNFWLESGCNTPNTTIWVRVPKIPANSAKRIYLYYGNATATNMSNGSLVFDFFDDFVGTSLNTSIWAIYSSNYAVSGGTLRLNTGGVELVNPLPFRFQDGYIAEVRVSHANTAATTYGGVLPSVASSPFTNASNANASSTVIMMRGTGSTTVYYWIGSGNTASFDVANGVSTGWVFGNNVWNISGISVFGGNVRLWRDRQTIISVSNINWAKNITYVKLGSYHRANTYNIHDTIYDWIIVRKYIEPQPIVTLNNELNATQLRIYQYNYSNTWWEGRYNYTVFARNTLGNAATQNDSFIVSVNASIFVNTTNATYRQDENVSISYNSNITNYGNEFFGLVEVYIENNVSGSWKYIATLLNDSRTGTIRRFSSNTFFNLSNVSSQWNTTYHLGNFRVVARVVNPYGNVLNSSNSQPLISISYFDVIPTILKINITSLNESARADNFAKITIWNRTQIINYSFGSTEVELLLYETYNITFERNCSNPLYVIVRDVNITRRNITSQIICNYNNNLRGARIITPIFALNVTNITFKNSTLVLPKTTTPTHIFHCKNWSFISASCSDWEIIPKENMLDYYENETHIRFVVTKFDAYAGMTLPDLVINDIEFNVTSAKEFENIGILVNVSNNGDVNVTNAKLRLRINLWNGTSWVNETNYTEYLNLSVGEYKIINYTWMAKPGTWRFNASIDPENEIDEINENNNEKIKNYTISAWHIFYGKVNSKIILMGYNRVNFTQWIPETIGGTLYFADYDSIFSFSNLAPLNGTNDLYEADVALKMVGFNDSIRSLYDKNNDNYPDSYDCFIVNGQEICNVPIINSTNNNYGNFITGILWDKGDGGNEYNGTQDLIFITKINKDSVGSYGIYDYEIAVPCYLRELRGNENLVVIYFELY